MALARLYPADQCRTARPIVCPCEPVGYFLLAFLSCICSVGMISRDIDSSLGVSINVMQPNLELGIWIHRPMNNNNRIRDEWCAQVYK